jgi:hypothetical protein
LISAQWANPSTVDIGNALTNSLDRNGKGGMLAQFNNAPGTVTLPGITWANELNSGFFLDSSGDWRSTINGVVTTRHLTQSTVPRGERQPFQVWDGATFYSPMTTDGGATPQFKDLTSKGAFSVASGGVTVTAASATIASGGATIGGDSTVGGTLSVTGTISGYTYDPDWTFAIIGYAANILADLEAGITSVATITGGYRVTFSRALNSATSPIVMVSCCRNSLGAQAVVEIAAVDSNTVDIFTHPPGSSSAIATDFSIYANTPAVP